MNIMLLDDEPLVLEELQEIVEQVCPDACLHAFTNPEKGLAFFKANACDIVFLDIHMPLVGGMELAASLKQISKNVNIIFVTGFSDYAIEAFSLNASGYIMKPPTEQAIRNALDNLRIPVAREKKKLVVQCFGNFEVFYDGMPLIFKRSKAKELLAYLVNLNGASCNTNELCAVLWEDADDTEAVKSNLRNVFSELYRALEERQIGDAVIHKKNYYAVDKSKIDCDYFRYLDGAERDVSAYKGEYMSQFSWAEVTHGFLESKKN